MKKHILIFTLFISFYSYSQIGFDKHIIFNGTNSDFYVQYSSNYDIDNDSDLDIVYSGNFGVSWLENDGLGNFENIHIVVDYSGSSLSNYKINVIDLDNDGFLDIVAKFNDDGPSDGKVVWYKNIDGNGNFSDENYISSSIGLKGLFSIDLDSDGDNDVISGYYDEINSVNKIVWFENTNGLGAFGTEQIITTNIDGITSIFSLDIDNDGDNDVVSSSYNDNKFAWYENIDGQGTFSTQQIILTTQIHPLKIYAKDIDNDSDLDLLLISKNGLKWYKNTDAIFTSNYVTSFYSYLDDIGINAIDIDNDDDIDIVAAYQTGSSNSKVVWFENLNGLGDFSSSKVIYDLGYKISSISTGDFDNDNDNDIIMADPEREDHKLVWFENLGLVNEINGSITMDADFNGCDSSDISLSNIMVTANNGLNSYSTFSQNGIYKLMPNIGNYTITATPYLSSYYTFDPTSHNVNFTDVGNTVSKDFCLEPITTGISDLNVSIYPLADARPGFNSNYQIVYKNVGLTVLSGDVTLVYDNSKLNFLNASQSVTSQTSNSLTFNFSNLNLLESRTINLNFNVLEPPITNIGDILTFTSTINPITGDQTEDDNVFNFNQTVIGSFDPNNITVLEGNQILLENADKYLHYIIRFQNTGTASAINIKVANLLDDKLDWTTLQLESLSHSNNVEIINGNEVSFNFNNIFLPDSTTDEPNSHGFIAYKIKPKNDIALDDIIINNADIFFDYNPPIETNTVSTRIVNVLTVNENTLLDFSVYPTPTDNVLNIKSKTEISKIEIYSKLGQLILINETKNNIDISNLTNGLYFVKVEDLDGNFGVKKIMKK